MRLPFRSAGSYLALCAALLLASCGGGSSGGGSDDADDARLLALIDVSVSGTDQVPLNTIVRFEFSADLDPDTVRPDTVQIRQGPGYGKQVPGSLRVDGNVVEFYPRLPVQQDLSDLAFKPGTPYRITLPGLPDVAVVRSWANEKLPDEVSFDFSTADSSSPNMFIDNFLDPLPPMVEQVNPPDGATDVPADSNLVITFNRRPLDPRTVTDSNIRLYMESRRGEVLNRPFPMTPILKQNHFSVSVEIVPKFPLADEATYRLEVDRRVQDLVGNDVQPPEGQSQFVSHFTIRNEPFRYSDFTMTFDAAEKDEYMDENETTASWNEAEPDAVAALFTAAGGNGTAGDLKPNANQTLSPDDFTRGVETRVIGGIEVDVYNFRTIEIPANVSVRIAQRNGGPNRPAMLLSLKNVVIAGSLTVNGGNGQAGEGTQYTTSRIPLARGGSAGPGGGDGADNDTTAKVPQVEKDGENIGYGGGGGQVGGTGTYSYSYASGSSYAYRYYYSYTSGGGGGGGSREAGEDGKKGTYPSNGRWGKGGPGGKSTTQRGYALNFERTPNVGGAGGGAGGKGYYDYYYKSGSYTRRTQYMGGAGAGGGGGGAITVQSAGDVTIASTGGVFADGGDGGRAMLFYIYSGGAGGGGAGGSVKVVATGQIYLEGGATISVEGGEGGTYQGTYTYYHPGAGGAGSDGYIRFEALEDENSPGKALVNGVSQANLTYGPPSTGTFAPMGGGAPSVAQTVWINLGVYDPVMFRPEATDIVSTLYNDQMEIFVQMAQEDPQTLGQPLLDPGNVLDFTDADGDGEFDDTLDPTKLSEWTPLSSIEDLNENHFQFIRIRIKFQLDSGHMASHPLPYLDEIRLPFGF